MRKTIALCLVLGFAAASGGCAYMGAKTNLKQVADGTGMKNITTGDGTFENYTATGHHSGCEIGIAVGLPGIGKFKELWPIQSNEELLTHVAKAAQAGGANAMIQVTPHSEFYTGIPFMIVGLYIDHAEGTGIAVK